MQFVRPNSQVDYFVGVTEQSILADTKNGTEFGDVTYRHRSVVSREVVEKLGLRFFHDGDTAVDESGDECFLIGSPSNQ